MLGIRFSSTFIQSGIFALLLTATTSCAELGAAVGGVVSGTPSKSQNTSSGDASKDGSGAQAPAAQLNTLTDCDAIEKLVQKGGLEGPNVVATASSKIAKCGHWDTFFTKLVHREADSNSDGGGEALAALTKEGYDVEKELFAFMDRHAEKPMAFEYSDWTVRQMTRWMKDNRPPATCQRWIPYAEKMEDGPKYALWPYFAKTKCVAAAKLVATGLLSDDADARASSCALLGDIGDASNLKKLQILADTDATVEVQKTRSGGEEVLMKVYPVRDTCRAAAGKIQLRAAP